MKPSPLPFHCLAALLCSLLTLAFPVLRGAETPAPKPEEQVTLPTLTVKGEAICSFGFGVVGAREEGTKKIKGLFISMVAEHSEATHLGLKAGDEILTINGVPVAGMDGTVQPGSKLFDLLVNQPPGQRIEIEVAVRTVKTVKLTAAPRLPPSNPRK